MLGIDPATQTDKLRKGPWTNRWASPAVAADGRRRRMACLPLRELPVWLGGISARRVAPGVREILWALQLEV
ncbi:phage antirepressor N-terminal domain-containing protein, partial [Mycobacterium tuberculosis]|nr:phage antirepressor N-terminal domain-containing protein [Mycobacterium tuberculosis]